MLDLFQPVIPAIKPTRRVTTMTDEVLAVRRACLALGPAAYSAKAGTPAERRQRRLLRLEKRRRALGMKPRVVLTPEQRKERERTRHQRKSKAPEYRARKAKAAREWRARQKQKRMQECMGSEAQRSATTTKGVA